MIVTARSVGQRSLHYVGAVLGGHGVGGVIGARVIRNRNTHCADAGRIFASRAICRGVDLYSCDYGIGHDADSKPNGPQALDTVRGNHRNRCCRQSHLECCAYSTFWCTGCRYCHYFGYGGTSRVGLLGIAAKASLALPHADVCPSHVCASVVVGDGFVGSGNLLPDPDRLEARPVCVIANRICIHWAHLTRRITSWAAICPESVKNCLSSLTSFIIYMNYCIESY